MELIDRATLGREISLKVCLPCPMGEDFECKDCLLEKAMGIIEAAPTIDAVPVVRCKECENWTTEFSSGRKSLGNYCCLCQEWSDAEDHRFTYTGEDEYCSRGERREG